jgi:hypothetical protein
MESLDTESPLAVGIHLSGLLEAQAIIEKDYYPERVMNHSEVIHSAAKGPVPAKIALREHIVR